MADDKETLFTVNAGQILAKLHLAGKEAAKDKYHFIVINSGMKDEADDNTAENPGKSLFDLTNKSGEYEVCFVTDQPFQYKEQIVLSADPDVQKKQEKLSDAKENARDAEDNDNNKGITSQQKDEAPKANEDVKNAQQDLNITAQKETGVKIPKDATSEERKEAIDKENEKRDADKDKNLSVWKKNAVDAINIIKKSHPHSIKFLCIIAAPEGIKALTEAHPDVQVFCAAKDEGLNENCYIMPGLGDAGDRIFGTK